MDGVLSNQGRRFPAWVVRRGGAAGLVLKIVRLPGREPQDLAGCVVRAQVRDRPGGDLVVDLGPFCSVPDPADGRVVVFLPGAATEGLRVGAACWDVLVEWPGGARSWAGRGPVVVEREVTRV
jgi:hypothetical protein